MVERMKIVSTENFDWCLPDSDTHFAEMLSINSEYQFKIKNIILEYAHLLNFENTIDVGANIGLWSRWLSQQGAKNIDCFEPIAKNLECLRKNVQDIQNLNKICVLNSKNLLLNTHQKQKINNLTKT
jgi:23S rRNA U2552 (ribose-2'-O)-methylase RlmE/FtsJ